MKVEELMAKAKQAAESAKLLLEAGDADGACNRAYYAMFDAARAAPLASRAPVPPEIAKTHNGLITAFSMHLVKPGLVTIELGRTLNKAEDLRLIADYKGDPIEIDEARWAVNEAQTFVSAIQTILPTGSAS